MQVVLRGDFNPAIFTPAWFALHGLLPDSVAENANVQVVHPQVATFDADWVRIDVTSDQLTADTSQAPYVRVRDLIARTFREHLHHTPLKAFGINRIVHFHVRNMTDRNRLGRTLAPVEPWGEWTRKLGLDRERGGMTALTMSAFDPENGSENRQINVNVEPSKVIGGGRTGVYVSINDHYGASDTTAGVATRLMETLEKEFDDSLNRSEGIIDHLMSLTMNQEPQS